MPFKVRWTEPTGAKVIDAATAKEALENYVEVLGKGFAAVEARDDSGRKMKHDDLIQLMAIDTRNRLDAQGS
jgi:hypothetical protein